MFTFLVMFTYLSDLFLDSFLCQYVRLKSRFVFFLSIYKFFPFIISSVSVSSAEGETNGVAPTVSTVSGNDPSSSLAS